MIIKDLDDAALDAIAAMEPVAGFPPAGILTSLVKHLHRFVRDVRLSEDESRRATAIPPGYSLDCAYVMEPGET